MAAILSPMLLRLTHALPSRGRVVVTLVHVVLVEADLLWGRPSWLTLYGAGRALPTCPGEGCREGSVSVRRLLPVCESSSFESSLRHHPDHELKDVSDPASTIRGREAVET